MAVSDLSPSFIVMERYTKYLDSANSIAKSTEIPTRLQIVHGLYRE